MDQLDDGFWTFRGSFKIGGVLDIGTHMSLVRRASGRFVLIDSYSLGDDDRRQLMSLTDNGRAIEAVLNVHPFHTLHCAAVHRMIPHAKLYGTRRHHTACDGLPWQAEAIEAPATQQLFADDLEFSVPDGVDFICPNEKVHVASVLVRHRALRILHVDDTLNVTPPPKLLKAVLPKPALRFHPLLKQALQHRDGAAEDYRRWARKLADSWSDTAIVCTAHSAVLRLEPAEFSRQVLDALKKVEPTLAAHEKVHG